MGVYPQVAFTRNTQTETTMTSKSRQHVVEKAYASLDFHALTTIQLKLDDDVRLACDSLYPTKSAHRSFLFMISLTVHGA